MFTVKLHDRSGYTELTETLREPERVTESIDSSNYYQNVYLDAHSLLYLFLLYTIQGIPMGLSASIPFILQQHISYKELAIFSLASLPFSLKILWAPIVDSVYVKSIGRRKSWLIPSQLICAFFMYYGGQPWAVSKWLGPAGHIPDKSPYVNIYALSLFFAALYFLMATQDIAVDGWALTLLNSQNKHLGSICNTLGQTVGFSVANVGFLALLNPELCNKWLRKTPSPEPLITLGRFLRFWSVVIFFLTLFAVFFPENIECDHHHHNGEVSPSSQLPVTDAYLTLFKIIKLTSVVKLILILLTCRIPFAPADVTLQLKLVELGITKEELALYGPLIIPASILCPIFLSRKLSNNRQLNWFLYSFVFRLILMLSWTCDSKADDVVIPFWLHCLIFSNFLLYSIASDAMFFSQMAFFANIADQVVGGTYMTLLNTIANLGNKWPHTTSLVTLKYFDSYGIMDGLILQIIFSIVIGFLWIYLFKETLYNLKTLHPKAWMVSDKDE